MPNNLEGPHTRFIGRRDALASLEQRIGAGGRLVTVVGPAGAGKTRLAVEYLRARSEELAVRRPGGVWMCDLTDARSVDGLCAALANVLEIPLARSKGSDEHVALIERALFTRGPSVLLLDNVDNLVEVGGEALLRWMKGAPSVLFLVTSRTPLGLESEQVLDLPPLALPSEQTPQGGEAVELFVERATTARAGFAPSPTELDAIASIVTRLDGIPLAIELAAARMRVLGVAQIERHLGRRFELLRSRHRSERHSTMRRAIDWSWELLDESERSALAQCSVFRGGFDLDAAMSVVSLGEDAPLVLDVVQALVERSLIRVYEKIGGELRYRLYESVREYAAERLESSGDASAARERHSAHYAALAGDLAHAVDGRGAKEALDRLALEMENLLVVHRLAVEAERADRALAVAVAMEPLLRSRGPLPPLLQLLDAALGLEDAESRSWGPHAVLARGHALGELGRADESEVERKRAHEMAREAGDRRLEGRALASLARHAWHAGRLTDANALYQEALSIHREVGDRCYEGRALSHRANALYMTADTEGARTLYRQALRLLRDGGDPQSEALTLGNLGSLEHDLGRHEEARVLYENALTILRSLGDRYNEANYVMNLGTVTLERGDHESARRAYEHSLFIQREVGNRRWEGIVLAFLALCDELEGHLDDARRHHHQAESLLRDYGHPVIRALAFAWRGRMEADADALEDAQGWLDEAQRIMSELGDTIVSAVPALCHGHLLLARARAADSAGDLEDAESYREQVRELLARHDPDQVPSSDVRIALVRLGDALSEQSERPTLIPPSRRSLSELPPVTEMLAISASARAFCVPGAEPVDLSTRRAPRRILAALADQRERYPGLSLSLEELLAAGWPGEKLLPEAGATRVYTAIATLRRMGLKPFLLRGDDGYLLDPAAPLARMPESA